MEKEEIRKRIADFQSKRIAVMKAELALRKEMALAEGDRQKRIAELRTELALLETQEERIAELEAELLKLDT